MIAGVVRGVSGAKAVDAVERAGGRALFMRQSACRSPLVCVALAACAVALACGAVQSAAAQTQPGASAVAPAALAADAHAPHASEVGHATLSWLDLQRSGREAAPAQTMLGAEATLAYQRYLESFRTKIPASFGSSIDTGYTGNQLHVDYTNSGGAQN
ncbi:DUF3613 domain-containing protein [Paraburkholderia humisilvae]|uniref:DUF3613 domain-containing protein n=1 Tax=Paraburkholderia humisilvae TaxID=627669 RepID=A0A6J5E286_9BURK|nr:DUF3613 domain-containing protein [Paraburkholderia humisilvae]CAB3760589.1 hypothetical protein LMG29542_03872 [Paraburkholderia humisilvae]